MPNASPTAGQTTIDSNQTAALVHYPAIAFLAITHLLALASIPYLYFFGIHASELTFHLLAAVAGGFGITALYHRAWAHNAVVLVRPVEYALAILSTFMLQMPARQWISAHLKHHKHTDHDDDPYNIGRGFWWAHFEWIIFGPELPIELPRRLHDNPVVLWQEKYYWPLSVLLNLVAPIGIAVAAGSPWWGGLLVSALRLVLTSHAIYGVNSVCHTWGTRPFTKEVSARDVWWFPFVLGEQYHNYHHTFPRDYRHGVDRFAFDPTKWLLAALTHLGLAGNLVAVSASTVNAARKAARDA
jgi:stearoyl-CoA desaturase (Delta-9 desaturase)